ncbi:PAS domain-containing sensor histidine kinase [Leptospira kobayashii]|uniref:histidine kinase n=1 Tax=Leptospira kobayashii TaxID=1917830 RepID=A0ABM7UQX0_9LEPT|nr:ATP-binding protein [Leptospira kobayashii]BDA77140.1 PAS domain-containing sensor histidine kinase [Leptospira kobayashii]
MIEQTNSLLPLIQSLFLPSYEGFLLVDSKSYRILIANPSIEKLLGFSPGELPGLKLESILPQNGLFVRMINVLNEHEINKKALWQLRKKNGELIHIEFMLQRQTLPDDFLECIAIYVEDKSAIKDLEIQINFTQNLFQAIREVKQTIQEDKEPNIILQTACHFLQKAKQYDFVWGVLANEFENHIEFSEKQSFGLIHRSVTDFFNKTETSMPMKTLLEKADGNPFSYSNKEDKYKDWYEELKHSGVVYGFCFPISWNNLTYGGLEIISFQENPFTPDEISIINEIAVDIGFAIFSKINEEERYKVLKKTRYQGKLLDTIEIPIFTLDQYLRLEYANDTAIKTLGISFQELKTKDLLGLFHLEDEIASSMLLESVNKQIIVKNNNNEEISMMFQSSIIRDDNDDFQGLMVILFNLSELAHAEEALRNSEERLRTIFATMNNGIVVVNDEGIILDIAPIFKFLLFQVVPMEAGDFVFSFLDKVHQDLFRSTIQEAQRSLSIQTRDFFYTILNEEYSFQVRFIPIKRFSNLEKVVMLVFTDTTEAKRLDRQLIESMKFVSIGEIAAGLAHEINNPLQSALLYLDDLIVVEEEDPAERKLILKKIESANLRIRDLVRALLDLGRVESPNRDLVSPYYILVRASELVEVSCKKKGIEFTRHAGPNLPGIFVRWQEIEQVLINCVVNSINAISEMENPVPNPKIEIGIDLVRISKKDWVVFSIEDNGPGMSENIIERAFLPLFTTRREKQGTGLGLSISKKIINDHEGDITIKSKLGEGTKIEILLPAHVEINE